MTNLFTQNSKMKKSMAGKGIKIVNFTLPAFRSKDGFSTCPNAKNCVNGCYARSGAYLWSTVSNKHHANLTATQSPLFVTLAIAELQKKKPNLVRVHDSGDMYSEEYMLKWFAIAKSLPQIKFYAYTKMVSLVKSYIERGLIPDNFDFIFSYGGSEDKLINPKSDRHSRVFEHLDDLWANGYIDASSDDMLALTNNKKIGLIFHHQKSYSNTNWNKVKYGS